MYQDSPTTKTQKGTHSQRCDFRMFRGTPLYFIDNGAVNSRGDCIASKESSETDQRGSHVPADQACIVHSPCSSGPMSQIKQLQQRRSTGEDLRWAHDELYGADTEQNRVAAVTSGAVSRMTLSACTMAEAKRRSRS